VYCVAVRRVHTAVFGLIQLSFPDDKIIRLMQSVGTWVKPCDLGASRSRECVNNNQERSIDEAGADCTRSVSPRALKVSPPVGRALKSPASEIRYPGRIPPTHLENGLELICFLAGGNKGQRPVESLIRIVMRREQPATRFSMQGVR